MNLRGVPFQLALQKVELKSGFKILFFFYFFFKPFHIQLVPLRDGDAFRLDAGDALTVSRWQKLTEGEVVGAVKQAGLTLKNKWAWRGKVNNMLVSPGMMLFLVQKPQR